MLDLVIRNGQVVTPQGAGAWEIAVQDGTIAAVAAPGTFREATRVIDAAGKIVVPGGVEPHTHLAHRIQMHPDDDLHTLGPEEDSRGMAFGGTTTHVDFAFVRPDDDLPSAVERRAARWKGNSYTDYTFHITLAGPLPLKTFDAIPEAIQQGFPSFKVFTTDVLPPHPKRPSNRLDFGRLQYAMEKVAPRGGIMVVHAEDHDIVQFMYERFREEGRMDGANLPLVHNKVSEMLSFRRAINLAGIMDAAIYFVHTSAREGVEAVAEARGHGQPIYAETLHHYTCFTADDYRSPRGFCYHTYPSLKYPEDQAALWVGLLNDAVSTTATDEYPTTLALKLRGKTTEDVTRALRAGDLVERREDPRPLPAQGRARARQRRRHRADRPLHQPQAREGRLPRERLQPVGGLGRARLAGHDDPARQGHRGQRPSARRHPRRTAGEAQDRRRGPAPAGVLISVSG